MEHRSHDPHPERKKRSKYPIVLLVLVLVNAILIALALRWLYATLLEFEAGTPATAIHRYFQRLHADDFEIINAESGFVPNSANTWEDYDAYLKRLYATVPQAPRHRKVAAQREDGGHTYALYDGDEKIAEVLLYDGAGQGGGWRVCAPVEYGAEYTVTAPAHATVTMNGIPLPPADAARAGIAAFDTLPDPALAPALLTYRVPVTLLPPTLAATDPWGNPCALEEQGSPHHLRAAVELAEERRAEYAGLIEAAARVYANYATNDATFEELAAHLYPESELYIRMRGYTDSQWYVDHDTPTFSDITVYGIVSHSETCFTGEIDFLYELTEEGRLHSFPSSYHMALVQVEGQWRLLDLKVQ